MSFDQITLYSCAKLAKGRFSGQPEVSEKFLDLLIQCYSHPELLDVETFSEYELPEILMYLKRSHQFYFDHWLPKIDQSLTLLKAHRPSSEVVKQLHHFLQTYQHELKTHILFEDCFILDFAQQLLKGNYKAKRKDVVIQHFLFSHDDQVILEVAELREKLSSVEPALARDLNYQVLFNQLELFQRDLEVHSFIEDELLIPKMIQYIQCHFESIPGAD